MTTAKVVPTPSPEEWAAFEEDKERGQQEAKRFFDAMFGLGRKASPIGSLQAGG